jgi:hypothetical protein
VIAHWSFDTGSITVDGGSGNVTSAADDTGNHNATAVINGTATGTSGPGQFGQALTFGNTNPSGGNRYYLTYDNLTELMGPAAQAPSFTVAAWVNTSFSAANNSIVADWGNAPSGNRFAYWFSLQSGQPRMQSRASNAPNDDIVAFQTGSSIADGQWHHIAYVFDKPNASAFIYVDGNQAAQALSIAPPLDMLVAASAIGTLGRKADTDNNFIGSMDEVWIVDSALNAAEVNNLRSFNVIPEPCIPGILTAGLAGLFMVRRRREPQGG